MSSGLSDAARKSRGGFESWTRALRSLERLDVDRAAALPQVRALTESPDPRVAASAKRISGR